MRLTGLQVAAPSVLLAAATMSGLAAPPLPPYAIVEIPALDDDAPTTPRSLNNRGIVTGASGGLQPFLFDPSGGTYELVQLPLPPDNGEGEWTNGEGWVINDAGQVAMEAVGEPRWTAALYDPNTGETIDLDEVGTDYCVPDDVDEAGRVVGQYNHTVFTERRHAFLWSQADGFVDLGTIAPPEEEALWGSNAHAISEIAGIVVGTSLGPYDGEFEEFRKFAVYWDLDDWEIHILQDRGLELHTLDVNDRGEIVGYNAAYWSSVDAEPIFLPVRDGDYYPSANAINNAGIILGSLYDRHDRWRQVIWPSPSARRYLEPSELLPPNPRWTALDALEDLNDANQIVGFGRRPGDTTFEERGFILSPVNPSFHLSTPSPGDAGTSNTFTVTGLMPGDRATLLYSTHGGGTLIPGCNLQTNVLQLDAPRIAGSALADSTGVATIQGFVPNAARNKTVVFQALVKDRCAISDLVVHQFQ